MSLTKVWMRKTVLGVLLRLAATAVLPLPSGAVLVTTGKFWRLFAPVSGSPGSLRVTPPRSRSIPSPPLATIVFERMALPVPLRRRSTPLPPLKAIVLPAPAAVPPIVLLPFV